MPYNANDMAKLTGLGESVKDTGKTVQVWFANGLGMSVAYHPHAYVGEGTCELAAIKRADDGGWDVVYSAANGWADVKGWRTVWEAVAEAAGLAQAKPAEFLTDMPSWED